MQMKWIPIADDLTKSRQGDLPLCEEDGYKSPDK